MSPFNPDAFRAQFPALRDAGTYLDSAATTLKPQSVIDACTQFYALSVGTVPAASSAAHALTERYEQTRQAGSQSD